MDNAGQSGPNVLLITADQWRGECLSTLKHPLVRTPTLDALAAEGVLFRNHFTQCAPCGPSRTSLLTGMYAMNHRSLRNGTPLDARFTNIAMEMRRQGYDPMLIGYTDTSLDPRGRDRQDPAARTYAGTLPGFTQLVPGSETDRAWLADLKAKGYPAWPNRNAACAPIPGYPGADAHGPTWPPPGFRSEDSETAFVVDHAILEYVVVHEMVHLLEPTHSNRFLAILAEHYPSWREARSELNELPLTAEAWQE